MIRRHRSGQSLVEFALIGSLLIILLLGLADFALAYYTQIAIKNAIAEGGYWIAQHPGDEAGARLHIKQELKRLTPPLQDSDIVVSPCTSDPLGGDQRTITIRYRHDLLFSVLVPDAYVMLGDKTVVPQMGGC